MPSINRLTDHRRTPTSPFPDPPSALPQFDLPVAGVDPIVGPEPALRLIATAMHHPMRHETIVLVLDPDRRGRGIIVVDGTTGRENVLDVVGVVAAAAGPVNAGLVVASIGPLWSRAGGDVDRWLEMSDIAERHGAELVEWFVIGAGLVCPRDLLAEPPRW